MSRKPVGHRLPPELKKEVETARSVQGTLSAARVGKKLEAEKPLKFRHYGKVWHDKSRPFKRGRKQYTYTVWREPSGKNHKDAKGRPMAGRFAKKPEAHA